MRRKRRRRRRKGGGRRSRSRIRTEKKMEKMEG